MPAAPSAASHPEWSQYTFTIGDNGGDGSEELSKVTGVFDDAPYKVKFADSTTAHRWCRRLPPVTSTWQRG